VNGLKLGEMEASDMIDVLHYFFEDDMNFSTAEQAEARDKTRAAIYSELYSSTYKYGAKRQNTANPKMDLVDFDDMAEEKMPEPFNPAQKPKAYTPPTPMNADSAMPFGKVLDAPMEH